MEMTNRRLRLRTIGSLAALTAMGVILAIVAGVASSKPRNLAPRSVHCFAPSQAPSGGSQRRPGPLLPGKPSKLLLCRYGPLPSQTLKASKLLTRRQRVREVVRGLNALPSIPSGAVSCPSDNGSSIVVYAMYRRSLTRIVDVGLSGCLIATRGAVIRWDLPSHGRFVHTLENLTR